MNTEFIMIIKKLIQENGREVLLTSARCKALLADYTGGMYKKESRQLIAAIDARVPNVIENTSDLNICRKQQITILNNEFSLTEEAANDVVNLLILILKDEKINCKYCTSCGKELSDEWILCPFCGTSISVKNKNSNNLSNSKNMVKIKSGNFMMGSPDGEYEHNSNERQHNVVISSYYISIYPVTQIEYEELIKESPSYFKGDNLPVENVNWYDAIEYCNIKSKKEGFTPVYTIEGSEVWLDQFANGYRLPTEAEWEYACRADTKTPYNTGVTIKDITGWYNLNSGDTTRPVGLKPANEWGLFDMHGNVWEWCWDLYGVYKCVDDQKKKNVSSTHRVLRGGSWNNNAACLRSASRGSAHATQRFQNIGFRLARNE